MTETEILDLASKYLSVFGPRLSYRARQDVVYRARHWAKHAPLPEFTAEAIEAYRSTALEKGYSPATIEPVVAAVRTIARHAGIELPVGQALTIPKPNPDVPRPDRVAAIYRSVRVAEWPQQLPKDKRACWWRGFIVLACWTGLRLSDLRRLDWSAVTPTAIVWRASKTRRHGRPSLAIPIVPTVRRHLEMLRPLKTESVLGMTTCHRQLRRELRRMASHAGVPAVLSQGFRRFAVHQWTTADSLAGKIVHGMSIGVMEHYLGVEDFLEKVAPSVQIPVEFLSSKEQLERANAEAQLVRCYRRAKAEDRRLIEDLIRRLG